MFSALFSFLGGSVFRMLWGEISSFLNKRQDYEHELEMLKLQRELDDAAHTRQMETIELQAKLQVQQITIQSAAEAEKAAGDAFTAAMQNAFKATGNWLVDAWNGIIRPSFATVCLGLWVFKVANQNWKMDEWDTALMAGIVGFFFADRGLAKRGK